MNQAVVRSRGPVRILLLVGCLLLSWGAPATDGRRFQDTACGIALYYVRGEPRVPHPDTPRHPMSEWLDLPLVRRFSRSSDAQYVANKVARGESFHLTEEDGRRIGIMGEIFLYKVQPPPGSRQPVRLEVTIPELVLFDKEKGRPLVYQEQANTVGGAMVFGRFIAGLAKGIEKYMELNSDVGQAEIVAATVVNPGLAKALTRMGFVSRADGKPTPEPVIERVAAAAAREIRLGLPPTFIGVKNGKDAITLSLLFDRTAPALQP